jgi:hypothetical protein
MEMSEVSIFNAFGVNMQSKESRTSMQTIDVQ